MFKMVNTFTNTVCLLFLIAVFITRSNCVKITKISVPKFVRNGTEESVILDCEYNYNREFDEKLVVKWFHENDPYPVYQWIPEYDLIQISEKYHDRVNEEFEISSGDKFTKRRALNILRPTTEFSGNYDCYVGSLNSSDTKSDVMTVYAHPKGINLNYSLVGDVVKVICIAENVYPVPEMKLFQTAPGETRRTPIRDIQQNAQDFPGEHSFMVILTTNIPENELATDTLRYLECVVSINGTRYKETKRIPYFPAARSAEQTDDDDDGARVAVHSTTLLLGLLIFLYAIQKLC